MNSNSVQEFFPKVFEDERGEFLECYSASLHEMFLSKGIEFIQDNLSKSKKGTVRGLHLQKNNPQGKLVTVVSGKALDVVVDTRPNSTTLGKKYEYILCDKKRNILWVPPGFAHGFQALEDDTLFLYKVTEKYDPTDDYSINPLDPELSVSWDMSMPLLLSEKDKSAPSFKDFMRTVL